MRRLISLILMLSLVSSLCVQGYAQEVTPRKNSVAELYSAEGTYTDSVGNMESYSFHVPQINAETEAAEEINREIAERFGRRVEDQLKNIGHGYSLWSWESQWHAYWYGGRLYIMLSSELEGGFTDIAAYGYDFDKACRVSNSMILEELDISESEYLENLREKVSLMFESMYSFLSAEQRVQVGYDELLEKTLGWLDLDQPMYIDGTGQIVTIVKIASVAGAEWYYHLATPFSYG